MMQMKIDLVLNCDNAAVTQLVSHLNASSTRTRHLSMRGAWFHDLHQRQALSLFFIDTQEQKADALTKGLGATLNEKARDHLCLTLCLPPSDPLGSVDVWSDLAFKRHVATSSPNIG
eukprot:687898-Amphidinium_carterae.1